MPLESHHKLSVRTKKQKSSAERPDTDRIRERVRAILKREKDESGKKVIQETRGKLKEFLKQMKPKDAPDKEERSSRESDLRYT
ncbi:MAG: hypothetical protein E6Q61_01190 [Nitrosomonas sp.]|nr:MAG: hypothetical protein E6Q61_01190 [Nitrosomonas sp.]